MKKLPFGILATTWQGRALILFIPCAGCWQACGVRRGTSSACCSWQIGVVCGLRQEVLFRNGILADARSQAPACTSLCPHLAHCAVLELCCATLCCSFCCRCLLHCCIAALLCPRRSAAGTSAAQSRLDVCPSTSTSTSTSTTLTAAPRPRPRPRPRCACSARPSRSAGHACLRPPRPPALRSDSIALPP